MRAANVVTAAVLALLGGVAIFDSLRLGIGWGTDGPKSGFFPFWLGSLLVLICGITAVRAAFRTSDKQFVRREQLQHVLKVLWPATAMVVLTQFLGLYVASALYLGLYMRWVGRHSWRAVATLSLGVPVVTFLVFEKWLLVQLPKGPLEAWLGY